MPPYLNTLVAQIHVTATSGAPSAVYTSVKPAFDAINGGTHKGVITIEITTSVTEIATASLNESGQGSCNYTSVLLYPSADGLKISGDLTAAVIRLNGADNVTIDGRVNHTGTTASLTIENTSTSSTAGTSTVEFINGAMLNYLQYCNLLGASTASSGGIVYFSSAGSSGGNDFNFVQSNAITCSSSNRPMNAICSIGSTGGNENGSNYITANSIFNVVRTDAASYGIYLGSGNVNWEVSGNSIYETTGLNFTANTTYNAIYLSYSSGTNFNIANNYIGGSAKKCGGDAMTKTGSDVIYYGINISVSSAAISNINGNVVRNISWTNTGNAAFYGIAVVSGTINIGSGGAGDTIGAATGTGSVTYTAMQDGGNFYGIYVNNGSATTCSHNVIASIAAANSGGFVTNFYGIYLTGAGAMTISGNTIGSTVTASSINASSASVAGAQSVYGIFSSGSNTSGNIFTSNTIANLVNGTGNTTTETNGQIAGILLSSGKNTVNSNTIRDLGIANANSASGAMLSTGGIILNTSSNVQTITSNTVYNLSNAYYHFTGCVAGLYFSGPSSPAATVSGNFIYNIFATGNGNSAFVYGIKNDAGTASFFNNLIYLSSNPRSQVFGIYEHGTSGNNHDLYFNTVDFSYEESNQPSFCLYSATNSNTRIFKNNVLNNNRNGNTASIKQYAIYYASAGGSLTTDYNDYYVSGNNSSAVGYYDGADRNTLADLRSANGQDANSLAVNPEFDNPGGTTTADYYPYTPMAGVDGTGITTDITNYTRASTPTIGAVEAELVVTWTGAASSDWSTATNWSRNRVPESVQNVTIPNTARKPQVTSSLPSPSYCHDLTIQSGAILTVNPGAGLNVTGTLINNNGNAGLVIGSNASGTGSVYHTTSGISATVERYIPAWADASHGWHFLSSPVGTQPISDQFVDLSGTIGSGVDFFRWSEPLDLWVNIKNLSGTYNRGSGEEYFSNEENPVFTVGKGYMIAYSANTIKNFTGTLNTADVLLPGLTKTAATSYSGWHLLGNPFSCAINWNYPEETWALENIDANCQIWKESAASYTVISPQGIIPPANGFMVHVTVAGTGSLTIPAAVRTQSATPWYKTTESNERILLRAVDPEGSTAQETIIAFNPDATDGFDPLYDSYFLTGYAPRFFSANGNEHFALNSLPSVNHSPVIPLHFIKNNNTQFYIELAESITGNKLFLTDLKLGYTQNLTTEPVYYFSSSSEDDEERFRLSFQPYGTEERDKPREWLFYYENQLKIRGHGIIELEIFTLTGQVVFSSKIPIDPEYTLNLNLATGFYIVRLTSDKQVTTKKIRVEHEPQ